MVFNQCHEYVHNSGMFVVVEDEIVWYLMFNSEKQSAQLLVISESDATNMDATMHPCVPLFIKDEWGKL